VSFLCPSCHTPLPPQRERTLLSCSGCGVSIDLRDVDTAPGAPGLSPERDLSGQVLGAYRLGARLGSGGMGIVYAAEGPEGAVAVKVLARGAASDPALRTRFRREAEALLALVHPAVVRVYAHGEHEGVAWYAMERLEGEDLARRLARGPLPIAEVQALAEQLLSGLACIHARGLVHRDLKPSNVLLFPSGAKLCDFGVARVEGARTLTESAALVGSLAYMAPEQRRGRSSAASDLYALGVLLCEAATHRLPEELSLDELQPRRLRALVTHLLAVRPEDRPASAEHARAMLVGAEGRGRQRRAAMVVGLLVVMVGVSLVVLERSWRPSAPASSPPLSAGVDEGARTVASGASGASVSSSVAARVVPPSVEAAGAPRAASSSAAASLGEGDASPRPTTLAGTSTPAAIVPAAPKLPKPKPRPITKVATAKADPALDTRPATGKPGPVAPKGKPKKPSKALVVEPASPPTP
jgi:serine/threonine protein kinase